MAFNFSIFKHSNYTFEGKRQDEEVEIFLYGHWIIITLKTIFYALLAFVPVVPLLIFSSSLLSNGILDIALFFLVAYWMIIWSLYFYEVMIYLLDTWIVTDQRILDIVQKSFFYRNVAELDITKVQDITVVTRGIIQTAFDFGDVEIESAGAALNKFRFRQVAHPNLVKDRIMKLVNDAKHRNGL